MADPPQLLRIPDAAAALSVSRTTMYRLIREGHIKTLIVGDRQRIEADELRRYIEKQKEG